MPLFRCYRCNPPVGLEFEANQPRCPKCNADPPAVLRLTPVHWLIQDMDAGTIPGVHGRFRCACEPQRQNLVRYQSTDCPAAVTCPRCKKSPGFEEALAEFREQNEHP